MSSSRRSFRSTSSSSSQNTFGEPIIDRMYDLRRDDAWARRVLDDSSARFIFHWNGKFIVSWVNERCELWLMDRELGFELHSLGAEIALLGREDEKIYVSLDGSHLSRRAARQIAKAHGKLYDLKTIGCLLSPAEAAYLAYSRSLWSWHSHARFCGRCGHPTEGTEAGNARKCRAKNCCLVQFPRIDPVVLILVTCGDYALLSNQRTWPRKQYGTLAGFVESGESFEGAVQREVFEEVGAYVSGMRYHSSQPWPFPGSLMAGFSASVESLDIKVNREELNDAEWFPRSLLRKRKGRPIILPSWLSMARSMIEDWLDED